MTQKFATMFNDRVVRADGCWSWNRPLHSTGYAFVGSVGAHRISYEIHVGPIPLGYEIDHLCRNRACTNPDHLEAVTGTENRLRAVAANRQATCPAGHERWGYRPSGTRFCRECARIRMAVRRVAA